jgi:RHS repeat-associated protein
MSTSSANDVDSFVYDSYTYRPINLTCSISPTSGTYNVSTALTWNANWSLQQMAYTDGSPSPLSQTCTYSADDLSRIASVNCGSSTWAQNFSYDAFGNINKSVPGGATGTAYGAAYSTVTNQVSSGVSPAPSYDGNGNQLTSTPATLTWNALNLPISVNSTTATYDALGRMVEKGVGGTYTQFVYRPSGAMLAVYSGGLTKGTIPLPGGATAVYNSGGLNFIRHKDWLGSSRLATTWAHAVYSKEAYAPFGETYNEAGTPDRSFTGQDQNVATGPGGSGVYDFLFRKYDPSAGRWLSPDPYGWKATTQEYPQSFNRYAYVQNNPMTLTDPDGLDCAWQNDDGTVSTSAGDCPTTGPGANGAYIDCNGCMKGGATFDSNGDLASYSDGTNNYAPNSNLLPGVNSMAGVAQSNGSGSNSPNNWVDPLIRQILDKMADKAIPASPWKPVSGIAKCVQQFFNDVTQQFNSQVNHDGPSPNAGANMARCLQGVGEGMSNPF